MYISRNHCRKRLAGFAKQVLVPVKLISKTQLHETFLQILNKKAKNKSTGSDSNNYNRLRPTFKLEISSILEENTSVAQTGASVAVLFPNCSALGHLKNALFPASLLDLLSLGSEPPWTILRSVLALSMGGARLKKTSNITAAK